uniref:Uncharacterized protein n=1 Tax=Rhizophora mucronata TaxID=61149 RepID=A0A2P2MZL8_RHIMU
MITSTQCPSCETLYLISMKNMKLMP